MNQNPSRSVYIRLLVLSYSSYTTEMLLSLWDSIMKEAAAFMHMEQGTESNWSGSKSFLFFQGEYFKTHLGGCTREEEKAQFSSVHFFKPKGVKWLLHSMKHRKMLCEVQ